jgi:uncharacterized protein (TIGR03000 family)
MLQKCFPTGGLAALAGVMLWLVASPAQAQISGSIGMSGSGYSGGYRGMTNGPAYVDYGTTRGYPGTANISPYRDIVTDYNVYGPGVGFYPTTGYPPFFMTSINYPGVYGAHTYGVGAYAYQTRPANRAWASPQDLSVDTTRYSTTATARAGTVAYVDVKLPADATLWVEDVKMSQRGALRQFVSPPLDPDRNYTYSIRASWMENGQEVVRDREVRVRAGDRTEVDLMTMPPATSPGERGTSTLRTRPLPGRE